jgi:GntR family transcriptional regulator/MocR family aminotransferase
MRQSKLKSKLIHVTPSCHYPIGVKMPLDRRLDLLQYAEENQSYIIENDYEHELNNWDNKLPSLFSLDQRQKTIYLGTFNRILHPSLRIGYIIVPQNLRLPFELMVKHSHRFVSPSIQYVLNQFIEKKVLHAHLDNLITITKERKVFFEEQFNQILKGFGFNLIHNDTLSLQSLVMIKSSMLDKEIVGLLSKNNISVHSFNKSFTNNSAEQGLIFGHCSIAKPIMKNKLMRIHTILQDYKPSNKN